MIRNADSRPAEFPSHFASCSARTGFFLRFSPGVLLLSLLIIVSALSGCGGGKGGDKAPPPNIGGGFTLLASGGTFNDGSGVNGLAVLVTLRDGNGYGPGGAANWKVRITGPGTDLPPVSYDDASPSSYMTWWWEQYDPLPGTYTATASNGATTLTCNFTIDVAQNLSQPSLERAVNTISWNALPGAGYYSYRVSNGTGFELLSGRYAADPLYSSYSFSVPGLADDGSYLVEVFAYATNRVALEEDPSASPYLAAQENISTASLDIVIGGSNSGYSLDARGGVLYEGSLYSAASGTMEDYYGLVIWTSILTTTASPEPPAGDWIVSVKGPGISDAEPITFTYPSTNSHYIYWDFGTAPEAGATYIVSAIVSGGTTSVTQSFTIPSPTARLPVVTGLAVTPLAGGGATLAWDPVPGASSYYVNVYRTIGGFYTEIAGKWVNSTSATIASGTLTTGVAYDVYVTACELDMTDAKSVPLPVAPGPQVNMSDNTFIPGAFIAQ